MAKLKVNEKISNSKTAVSTKQIPNGVKMISILKYVAAGIGVISGLLTLLSVGARGFSLIPFLDEVSLLIDKILFSGVYIYAGAIIEGILILGFAALAFFVGKGLWRAQKCARTLEIILCSLGVIYWLIVLFQHILLFNVTIAGSVANMHWGEVVIGIICIGVQGAIGGYLMFSKDVKKAFT